MSKVGEFYMRWKSFETCQKVHYDFLLSKTVDSDRLTAVELRSVLKVS